MSTKVSNRIFLWAISLYVILSLAISFTPILEYIPWNIAVNGLSCDMCYVLPILGAALIHKVALLEHCRVKKVKISTIFLAVLYTILIAPSTTLMNLISLCFTDNTVLAATDEIYAVSFPVAFLVLAILGPFGEELFYRGVMLRSYQRAAGAGKAILLSAFLFGVMHSNLNQFSYAVVFGILFGLLAEASGSLWPGFVGHALVNGITVCALFLEKSVMETIQESIEVSEIAGTMYEGEELLLMFSVYLFISVVGLALAFAVLVRIAKNENRLECLTNLGKREKNCGEEKNGEEEKKEKLISIPLILAILMCVFFIVWDLLV